MTAHQLIASFFGTGYIGKGSGSVAAIAACLIWYYSGLGNDWVIAIAVTTAITLVGIWSSNQMEAVWGHDNSKVVIDEVAGMLISLLFIPVNWKYAFAAFVLFRFFDILKPLFIRRMENLKGGWGVMMDDVLAGIYSNVVLQVVIYFQWF